MRCLKCRFEYEPYEANEPCPHCGWVNTDKQPAQHAQTTQVQKPIQPVKTTQVFTTTRPVHHRNVKVIRQVYHLVLWTFSLLGITTGFLLEIYLISHWKPAVELEHIKLISGIRYGNMLDLLVLIPCLLAGILCGYLVGGKITRSM